MAHTMLPTAIEAGATLIPDCSVGHLIRSGDRVTGAHCELFFFFKQKTAYEMAQCDWSSDGALPISVCGGHRRDRQAHGRQGGRADSVADTHQQVDRAALNPCGQEVPRAVRDPHLQATHGHHGAHTRNDGRLDEAQPGRRSGRGDQAMTNGLLGQKLGMTQVFLEGGQTVPVTVIEAGPCRVSQVKTKERDGYPAVQLAFKELPDRKASKPVKGHFAKANLPAYRHAREFRATGEAQVGATITVSMFTKGELVDVVGVSKGKGFQGVVKRHHFAGGPESHGSMFHRAP